MCNTDKDAALSAHGYETPERNLEGWSGSVRVVDIYDGDSVQIVLNDNGRFFRVKCRLSGIDTCEIRSKRAENKRLAYAARNRLASLVTECSADSFKGASRRVLRDALEKSPAILHARCGRADKYGRALIKLFSESGDVASGASLGARLVSERLAYRYHGGTKLSESEQLNELGASEDDDAA